MTHLRLICICIWLYVVQCTCSTSLAAWPCLLRRIHASHKVLLKASLWLMCWKKLGASVQALFFDTHKDVNWPFDLSSSCNITQIGTAQLQGINFFSSHTVSYVWLVVNSVFPYTTVNLIPSSPPKPPPVFVLPLHQACYIHICIHI